MPIKLTSLDSFSSTPTLERLTLLRHLQGNQERIPEGNHRQISKTAFARSAALLAKELLTVMQT